MINVEHDKDAIDLESERTRGGQPAEESAPKETAKKPVYCYCIMEEQEVHLQAGGYRVNVKVINR